MPETKIIYSGFYDFPCAFVANYEGTQYLFWRLFDEELDDYPSEYKVYILPDLSDAEITKNWSYLPEKATAYIGKVPINQITFDPSHRESIDSLILKRLRKEGKAE